jgi:hypothetical protein
MTSTVFAGCVAANGGSAAGVDSRGKQGRVGTYAAVLAVLWIGTDFHRRRDPFSMLISAVQVRNSLLSDRQRWVCQQAYGCLDTALHIDAARVSPLAFGA